jgi:pimeloyl-ACP methyl ester carboxylesterase
MKTLRILALFLIIINCSKSDETNEPKPVVNNKYLISSELLRSHSASVLGIAASAVVSLDDLSAPLKNIEAYKIKYKTTDVDGSKIEASGVVFVPQGDVEMPIVSYQHGTISDNDDAPSNIESLGNDEYTIMAVFSSFGFVVSMPDYIGYAASVASEHPYEHGNSLGSTSYDMLKATKEFLTKLEVKANNKLFLLGYSEGGYATLALQKYIENKGDLSITHSLPGAGAYNKTEFSKNILNQDIELPHMPNYLWVLYTYNRIYENLRRPWSDYVVAPYAEVLTNINSKDITQISLDEFETNPQKLFTTDFLKNLNDKTDEAFLSVLSDNDLLDWTPIAPITFYHGTEDQFVYPLNSISTAAVLKEKNIKVTYVPIEGENHFTGSVEYFKRVRIKINEILLSN